MTTEDLTYTIRRDGDAWLATRSNFENLQESISGFGPTPLWAFEELLMKFGESDYEEPGALVAVTKTKDEETVVKKVAHFGPYDDMWDMK